jgi:hypothetical protein
MRHFITRTLLHLEPRDHVLERLVEGVPDVQAAVCVGRAIVEAEQTRRRPVGGLPLVELIRAAREVDGTLLDEGAGSGELAVDLAGQTSASLTATSTWAAAALPSSRT